MREIRVMLRELMNFGQNLPEHLYRDRIDEIIKALDEYESARDRQEEDAVLKEREFVESEDDHA